MGQPYKSNNIRENIKRILNLEMYGDKVPAEIEDKIQLTLDVNPFKNAYCTYVISGNTESSGVGTGAFPTDKDFYVTSLSLSVAKNATNTSKRSFIYGTIGGVAGNEMIQLATTSLTAQNLSINITLPYPVKMDRGTTFVMYNDQTDGYIKLCFTAYGFLVDTTTYDVGIGAQK